MFQKRNMINQKIWHECYEFIENYCNRGLMKTTEHVNFKVMVGYTKETHKQAYYISGVLTLLMYDGNAYNSVKQKIEEYSESDEEEEASHWFDCAC